MRQSNLQISQQLESFWLVGYAQPLPDYVWSSDTPLNVGYHFIFPRANRQTEFGVSKMCYSLLHGFVPPIFELCGG
jgi:hypothetical protein